MGKIVVTVLVVVLMFVVGKLAYQFGYAEGQYNAENAQIIEPDGKQYCFKKYECSIPQ